MRCRVVLPLVLSLLTLAADAASLRVDLLPEKGRALVVRESDGAVVADTVSNGATTGAPGEGFVLSHDDAGRLVGVVAPDVEFVIQYDSNGRVALVSENNAIFRDIVYTQTDRGFQADVWHSKRGNRSYLYLPETVLIREQPLHGGTVTTTTVDRSTGSYLTKGADGTRTLLEPKGDLWQLVASRPGEQSFSSTFSSGGRVLESVSGPNRSRVMSVDALAALPPDELAGEVVVAQDLKGRPVSVHAGGQVVAEYGYDMDGQLSKITFPGGTTYQIVSDSAGRLVAYEDPGGDVTRFHYGADNSSLAVERPVSGRTVSHFDESGRMIRRLGPGDQDVTVDYAADGRTATVTQHGFDVQREEWLEDRRNVLSTYESERFGDWFFIYPKHEDTVTRVACNGGMTCYTYDESGRLARIEDGESKPLADYTHGTNGGVVLARTPSSLTARSYGEVGRLTEESDRHTGFRVSYAYDRAGLLSSVEDSGGHSVRYHYDGQRRITKVESSVFGVFNVAYGKYGLAERIVRPNGIDTVMSYDKAGRLAGLEVIRPGSEKPFVSDTVRTDAEGNYAAVVREGRTIRFPFDRQMHRCGVNVDGKRYGTSYDTWGNVLQAWENTMEYAQPGIPKKVNDLPVVCDDAGRITHIGDLALTYDWDNRLVSAEGVPDGNREEWTYDAFGRLYGYSRRSATNTVDMRFFFVGGRPYACLDGEGNPTKRYLFLPGFDPCFAQTDVSGKIRYPVWDGGGFFLFNSTVDGQRTARKPGKPKDGESWQRGGLCFLDEKLLYRNERFFCPLLNRALAPPSPRPFESAIHLDNPVSFGNDQSVKAPRQEVRLP